MGKMINRGKELIRINPKKPNIIEYSKNGGINWLTRTTTISIGDFIELTDNGNEILGTTTKGLYYSKNEGQNWLKRG